MSRIRFKWRKQITKGQLILKSSIPAVILLLAVMMAVLIINGDSRLQLNEMFYRNSSEVKARPASDLYDPILRTFKLSSFWVRAAKITQIEDPDLFSREMKLLAAEEPLINGMTIRDEQGREVEVYREKEGTLISREVSVGDTESLSLLRAVAGVSYMILHAPLMPGEENGMHGVRLSSPYPFPWSQEMGITLHLQIFTDEGAVLEIWLDLTLKQLALMMNDASISEDSVIYILMDDEEFVSYRIRDVLSSEAGEKLTEEEEKLNRKVIEAIYSYRENTNAPEKEIARIHAADKEWWTQFSTVEFLDSTLVIGSYTPENALLISRLQNPVLILGIILLLIAGFYFFFLIKDYRTALHQYLTETEEDKVRRMIALGENLYCEFKSSLRWDFREEEANRALEQVVMKSVSAFSNSDGGTLLIGVRDDGTVLGLENDYGCLKEGGTDFYELHLRTLLSNMFGVAYPVSHIKIDFPVMEGKEICRVQIRKGDEPLFLVLNEKGSGKTEKFFVRSGNSSRQISSLSEMSEYIMNRFD